MCKIILAKYKMYSLLGILFFLYCDALFVHFSPFLGVILISCHSLVLFHCKHYCAKCTVFKRMWMCIVSEPNKYNDVKPYFSIPVSMFLSFVSGKVVLMKLFAFCTLEIPKFQNLDGVSAFLLFFENAQRMQITLSAYSACQSLPHLCASETAHQRDEEGPVWTRCGSRLTWHRAT